ncbi:ABC transporter permease [Schaalia dentiphila]|uniref:Molybdate ABC transporter, permease protein n=1 Tax=Schaalia dentiphila ATCC 17982 TaxID=411466 RepID=A7BBD7_9ACTO|nr:MULTISPECIES: ABC transporter permease [Schaalia]EDN80511.1 molybdate ABC transporter, permease protein [Schaalia odontolytica ATCC 17982]
MNTRRAPAVSPLPLWAGGLGALALLFLALPLLFMLGRVNWADLAATLATDQAASALALSLRTCLLALGVDLILGVPAALLLSRSWRGVRAARILVALPLSLPPVVAGIALLAAFGRRSTLGVLLGGAGLDIAFTTTAVVIAQVFVSLPFLIVTLESALRAREPGLEEMASSLGASPTRVFWQITLPTVLPGLGRGTALALARCLGEFGATLTFAGSMQGVTRTMPLQIYLARESDADLALALGVVLLAVALLVVALTETPWGRVASLLRGASPLRGATRRAEGAGAEGTADRTPSREALAPDRAPSEQAPVTGEGASAENAPSEPVPVRVAGTIAQRGWEVQASLEAGLVTAVVGHNGAGKSTLAQVVAGTLRLERGEVTIGGRTVEDASTFVPARRRGVAMVSQAPRIFTHMSVLANVAFPLRVRGVGRAQARATATDQLRAVGIADLAHRCASDLSGGQAARVAIARALAFRPDVLILDEPTAALDVEATAQVSAVLRERLSQSGITTLLVSHDIAEVLALASRMIIMGDGRVVEEGEPARILASPSSVFAARLAGLNIVTGEAISGPGMVGVRVGEGALWAACDSVAPGEQSARVALTFPPEAVALSREEAHASPRSVLPGVVAGIDVDGSLVSVRVALAEGVSVSARVTASAWSELGLGVGDRLWASVKATQVRAIPIAPGS